METQESDVDGSLSGPDNDLSEEEDDDSRLSSNSRNDHHPMLKPSIDPEVLARLKQEGMPFGQEVLERSLPFFFTSPHLMASHLAAAAAAVQGKDINDHNRVKLERSPPHRGYPEETLPANHQTPASDSSTSSTSSQQTWSFEEQFKQGSGEGDKSSDFRENDTGSVPPKAGDFFLLYELSDDVKRKEFLDELFSFMQKRGTPINRLPIMAKQVLDLYELYNLVIARGGLVDVINKKLWQEIIKGLHLPSSITSAAFTLRTQYMKYLYPYECEKKRLSTPAELQAAIDGNRREGRRASYGPYPDMANNPMISPMSLMGGRPHQMNGNGNSHMHSTSPNSPPISSSQSSARDTLAGLELSRLTLWNMYGPGAGLPLVPAAVIDPKAPPQQEALDLGVPTRNSEGAHTPKVPSGIDSSPKSNKSHYLSSEKENGNGNGKRSDHHHNMSSSGPPPPKRMAVEESISPVSRTTHGIHGTHIKINSRSDGRGMDTSLAVSMEINGIMYQGVLFAQNQNVGRVS